MGNGLPWYVRTTDLRSGRIREPRAVFQIYEVTNAGAYRQRIPMLRRLDFPRWDS